MDPSKLFAAMSDNHDGEVSARWASDNLGEFRLVDVREPHELTGPLGKIDEAQNVPLLQVVGSAARFDPDTPVVLVCRSGRRSSQAAEVLRRAGVKAVASIEGGMLAWNLDVYRIGNVVQQERVANTQNLAEAIHHLNGLPEVSAAWVHRNLGRFRLVDIRHGEELKEFGRVAHAEHVPMQTFIEGAGTLDKESPLVVMCASGGRSGRVVSALVAMGFKAVASLEGGLFGWRGQDLPTV